MELQFHEALEDNDIRSPLAPVDGRLDLRLLVDTIFLEIFSARGRYYTPVRCAFPQAAGAVHLRTTGGAVRVERLRIHELRSIWESAGRAGPSSLSCERHLVGHVRRHPVEVDAVVLDPVFPSGG